MESRRRPGQVRDAIVAVLQEQAEATIDQIREGVDKILDSKVPSSSVRSYLRLNTGGLFERTGRGRYRLAKR